MGDILSDTGLDEMILEPTIGWFDFASGLGRDGVNDLHIAILQDLFPLRGGLVGQGVVFIPEGVSSPGEAKNRMRIDIVGVRGSTVEDDRLEVYDMGPDSFFLEASIWRIRFQKDFLRNLWAKKEKTILREELQKMLQDCYTLIN